MMTREQAKNILPIIQAYAGGAEIQYFHKGSQKWISNDGCGFISGYEYRVKPEPRTYWLKVYKADGGSVDSTNSKAIADRWKDDGDKRYKVIQTIEVN